MTPSRLLLAAQSGDIDLPSGGLTWLNAPGGGECGLEGAELRANQSFYPEFQQLESRGINTSPILDHVPENALITAHRAKAFTFDLIAEAVETVPTSGLIAVDGDKTNGIESLAKELKRHFPDLQSYSKAHGKLLWFMRPDRAPDLSAWRDITYVFPNGWATRAGVFSSDGPDAGSKLLAEHLPPLKGRVAELGAGWGYLTGEILKSDDVKEVIGVEADFHAVTCAGHNIRDSRAQITWGDAVDMRGVDFDAVVTNPPFHASRKPDPALGIAFIEKAAALLKPKGVFWMVANRNLPYEAALDAAFKKVVTVAQSGGFKVIQASLPKTTRKGR
ncbi:MAG: methyltransferase [Litoreibacter sp.]|nr:methyltransferase [Litoreibacter sp.]MCY4335517.1 methyltransferase [Litoreibacter sp.]